jgi:hypothetical protein
VTLNVAFAFGVDVCFNNPNEVSSDEIIRNCINVNYVGDIYCRTDVLTTAEEAICRQEALTDSLSGLGGSNSVIGGRSLVHSDATYLMAQLLGFSPWEAYQIMMYAEATDQGDYEAFNQDGYALLSEDEVSECRGNWGSDMDPKCSLITPDVTGLYKFNQTTGGMWLHLQPRYTPSSEARPEITYPIMDYLSDDISATEPILANLSGWVFGERENFCVLGLTQDMSDVEAACEVEQEVVIEGYFMQFEEVLIPFTTVLGDFIVNEANDAEANDESLGAFIHPQDPGLAKLGVLIHVLGDRYSHNLCTDNFFIWKNEEGGGYGNEWDPDGCAQGLHFLAHVWEAGTDQSNLSEITHRTMQYTIEADFDLLERYAIEISGHAVPSVEKTEIVSEIMGVLETYEPAERLGAMVTLMEARGVLPLPEHGAYLGEELSIDDWLREAGALTEADQSVPIPTQSSQGLWMLALLLSLVGGLYLGVRRH